jgi:hypothetical protein
VPPSGPSVQEKKGGSPAMRTCYPGHVRGPHELDGEAVGVPPFGLPKLDAVGVCRGEHGLVLFVPHPGSPDPTPRRRIFTTSLPSQPSTSSSTCCCHQPPLRRCAACHTVVTTSSSIPPLPPPCSPLTCLRPPASPDCHRLPNPTPLPDLHV